MTPSPDDLPLTLGALIRRHAAIAPAAVVLATEDARLTYTEAERRSAAVARGMLAQGVSKGAHVGLLLPNGADFLVHMLAAARIGAVVLPFSTLSSADELRGLLVRSDTNYLVSARAFRGRDYGAILDHAFPGLIPDRIDRDDAPWLRRVWFADDGGLETGGVSEERLAAAEARVAPADRLVIIHTSGSTSLPKGVIHQHGSLIRHLANANEQRGYAADDVLYSSAPWFWVAGFAFGLLSTLIAGARIVQSNSRDAGTVLDLLEHERPTLTNGYGPSVAWLAEDPSFPGRDFSWLRRGNLYAIMAPDLRPADPTLRHDIYGTSETGSALTLLNDTGDLPEHLRGACGKLLPGWEARIVDPETGRDCGQGETGELWVRGPFMMEGYYGRPRHEAFEPDGWWRSSDAFAIEADGIFVLKGRLGNIIKTAGANVAPREVESVLGELAGGVPVVMGLPDAKKGQVVVAVLFTDDPGFDEADLRRRVRERLSSYKIPVRILAMPMAEMPTLSSGKINTAALRATVERLLPQPA